MKPPPFWKKPKSKKKEFEVIRKNLDDGIAGEANNDETIFITTDIPEGSTKEKVDF